MQFSPETVLVELRGTVTHSGVRQIHKKIAAAQRKERSVLLVLNSQGGSLEAALRLAKFIEKLGIAIDALNTGTVASSAVAIFMACRRRFAVTGTAFHFHETHLDLQEVSAGPYKARDLAEIAKAMRQNEEEYIAFLCSRSDKLSLEMLRGMMKRDAEISAEEAQSLGIAHEIVSPL